MEVIRNTPDQLILANRPWPLAGAISLLILIFAAAGLMIGAEAPWFGALFGGTGVLLGAAAFAAFVRRKQVILDKASGTILIRRRSVFGYAEAKLPLHSLTGAELQTTRSATPDGRSSTLYRPVLMVREGPHPIEKSYTATKGPQRLVDAVNNWLKRSQTPA